MMRIIKYDFIYINYSLIITFVGNGCNPVIER